MSKSIEADTQKSKKRAKAAKIVAIVAAVLVLGWTVYSVAMNLNKSERMIVNSFIKVYRETKEPAANVLADCSKIYDGQTASGKAFRYVIVEVRQGETAHNFLLVVDGKGDGKIYTPETLSRLDFPDKGSVKFEISEHEDGVSLSKMQKTLLRYWQFHDVA